MNNDSRAAKLNTEVAINNAATLALSSKHNVNHQAAHLPSPRYRGETKSGEEQTEVSCGSKRVNMSTMNKALSRVTLD